MLRQFPPLLDIAVDHSGLESALEPDMHINQYPYAQTSTKPEREKAASLEAA
jgi:hypothetical protein